MAKNTEAGMKYLARGASLTGYVELAQSLGLDPFQALRMFNLPAACIGDPEATVPIDAACRLLEQSALWTGAEDFGLRLGAARTAASMGPMWEAASRQATLRDALAIFAQHTYARSNSAFVHVEERGELAILRLHLMTGDVVAPIQAIEMVMGLIHRVIESMLGGDFHPQAVCFAHNRPKAMTEHWRVFGRNVDFEEEFDGMVLRRSDLDRRIRPAEPGPVVQAAPRAAAEEVLEGVMELLPTGACSVYDIAGHFGVDRRTIHRRLAAQGLSVSDIVQDVRREFASRYLTTGRRSLCAVSERLGFSEQSAFTRWFRKSFGCTPTEWRRRHLVDPMNPPLPAQRLPAREAA
jgi:AraC-like DNA-binding protein